MSERRNLTVAKAPCKSCPYRQDVPSGVWAADEYEKLPTYDGEVVEQAMAGAVGRFDCHQRDGHMCAGWVATHGAHNLLALRLASDRVDEAVWEYESPVPVFASGQEACDHGKAEIERPSERACRMVGTLTRQLARKADR